MFDPKSIYGKLNIREIIGDDIRYEIIQKEWPANEMAYFRLESAEGRVDWVLIAPGSTAESVTDGLYTAAKKLRGEDNGL